MSIVVLQISGLSRPAPHRTGRTHHAIYRIVQAFVGTCSVRPFIFAPVNPMQITGLKSPAVASSWAEELNALKIHPSTTLYRPPDPRRSSG